MKIVFVILHYLNQKDTIECIESILRNIEYETYKIVVVDNGSKNNSGKVLQEKYKQNDLIHLISSNENLGFAKGNNLGFSYAKENLNADFIVLINSDTIIEQAIFAELIVEKYKSIKYDILGPDIISLVDRGHQNPYSMGIKKPSIKKMKKMIFRYDLFLILNLIGLDKKVREAFRKITKRSKSIDLSYKKEQFDIPLHGSCLIFSPDFVRKFKGLYDKTFLYMEEDILYYIAKKEGLSLVYTPEIKILHKEDGSTNPQFNSGVKKRKFIYKNARKSALEFYKILKNKELYKENMIEK